VISIERPAIADYPAGTQLPTRVIDDYELVWMLRGQARVVGDDDDHGFELVPGRLLVVPPGVPHGFAWDPRRASRHGYVHFSTTATMPTNLHALQMTPDDPLAGLCAYLLWLGRRTDQDDDGWQQPASQALGFLLAVVVSGPLPENDPPAATLPPPLAAAIDHLRHEWSEMPLRRIGVGELAAAVSVSRSHLSRVFRRGLGLGAATALERVRFSHAETLLARTDLTVDTIAHQCGFADLSHFSHRFTAHYGLPPSDYRSTDPTPSVLDHPGVRRLTHLLWG
jgi:AraC family transcriptional regulator